MTALVYAHHLQTSRDPRQGPCDIAHHHSQYREFALYQLLQFILLIVSAGDLSYLVCALAMTVTMSMLGLVFVVQMSRLALVAISLFDGCAPRNWIRGSLLACTF